MLEFFIAVLLVILWSLGKLALMALFVMIIFMAWAQSNPYAAGSLLVRLGEWLQDQFRRK